MKKVIVLGGGFAGIEAAIKLQKSKQFDVVLVSERDYLYLYPVSIWIPTEEIDFKNTKVSIQEIQKQYPFRLITDKVESIHSSENKVVLQHQTLTYDYLVIATGSDKMKPKGAEHTFTICGAPEGNLAFKDKFLQLVKKGKGDIAIGFGGNPKDKSAVRGGPAFELIFNIDHYLRKKKIRDNFNLTFFAPMAEPGAKMGRKAMQMVHSMFKKQHLQQRFGLKIQEFEANAVIFEDGTKLNSDLTMFIAAGTGPAIFKNSDLPLSEAGFIQINDSCKVKSTQNVYAVGDAAALEGPEFSSKQGHLAEIMGRIAAHNIIESENGSYEYKGYQEHLSILCVMDTGNGAAYVYRDRKKAFVIPMPIVGHWLKKAWGYYIKWSKTGKIPRFPGM